MPQYRGKPGPKMGEKVGRGVELGGYGGFWYNIENVNDLNT
jgi:hypothetical protein